MTLLIRFAPLLMTSMMCNRTALLHDLRFLLLLILAYSTWLIILLFTFVPSLHCFPTRILFTWKFVALSHLSFTNVFFLAIISCNTNEEEKYEKCKALILVDYEMFILPYQRGDADASSFTSSEKSLRAATPSSVQNVHAANIKWVEQEEMWYKSDAGVVRAHIVTPGMFFGIFLNADLTHSLLENNETPVGLRMYFPSTFIWWVINSKSAYRKLSVQISIYFSIPPTAYADWNCMFEKFPLDIIIMWSRRVPTIEVIEIKLINYLSNEINAVWNT